MLNLSSLLFTNLDNETCMLAELELSNDKRSWIGNVRREVRDTLRDGLPGKLTSLGATDTPVPRFFTQGSWAYKTLNAPAQPPQQSDIDDGCYLPLSFMSETNRPSDAAKLFFYAAEEVLKPLVHVKNWQLVTDKPTCIRIIVSDDAHIDIPLYAIPDEEFEKLATNRAKYSFESYDEIMMEADQDVWAALPSDKVLLAHREDYWLESDPRPLKDWFLDQVQAKGEQFRRVVRYLKAFRDWEWEKAGPSSVLLMAAAAPLFLKHDRRDDLALLKVVEEMPNRLREGVCNPVATEESLTDRLDSQKVEQAAKAFERFESTLRGSTDASSPEQACIWMIGDLGPRFPNEPHRVKTSSVKDSIASTAAAAGPSEVVGRSKAG